jgi:hypothetical protein
MSVMHTETFHVRHRDAATEVRLSALRSTLESESAAASRIESSRVKSMEAASSKARHRKVDLEHSRAEAASETDRRASDRAYFVRPLRGDQSELWQYGELRSWYGGGAGGGDAMAGDDFRAPSIGIALTHAGYSVPAHTAHLTSSFDHNPHSSTAPTLPSDTINEKINAARTAVLGETRRQLNAAHWSDRDALIAVSGETSRQLLAPTGFTEGLVLTSRPFKNRPAEDDTWRFNPPKPAVLKEAFMTSRSDAAHDGTRNSQRSKDTKIIFNTTDAKNYW